MLLLKVCKQCIIIVMSIEFVATDNAGLECNASYENPYSKLVKSDYEVNFIHVFNGILKTRLDGTWVLLNVCYLLD